MVLELNEAELTKAFPYGAMVIPRAEDDTSFPAALGQNEGDPETFALWDSEVHCTLFRLDSLTEHLDGYEATNLDGAKYFLRPLPQDEELKL